MEKQHYSILFTIIGLLHLTHGCSIDGINWFVPETREVLDTFRGTIFSAPTQNIREIQTVTQREGLNKGPYINVSLDNSILIIITNDAFDKYEDIETQLTLGYTITLRCTDSSTRNLVFVINLTDTNNNDPIFLPSNDYEFTIAPPVPPGFVVTTCLNDILVRDIDLTTTSIDFKINGSDLFEISFDPSSEVAKEFKATLKTTNLIRSIAEPIQLTVTATDVDLTEGPPRTVKATVVIAADSQFQFPDEPIFSQPFYLATYKSDNDVILPDQIFLRQGFDGQVKFSFESDHSEYFDLVIDQNNLSFNMKNPIPVDLYDERQIYLIVKATREHTSGATATVILKLPEDTRLEFENSIYEGTITDNVLQLTDLKLKQGYEGFNITVDIESEYTFRANIESNVIKISMDPLTTDVIQNNNFIHLQVTASNNRTTAVALVILEIIKDDYTTPVFENNFYSGSYSTELGLTLEEIVLTQGFDETVKITLEGEHFKYFQVQLDGARITLTSATIPPDIFDERNIMITVLASKPRTVGAHATVKIALPSDTRLEFENSIYEGTITDNVLQLTDLKLKQGYEGFNITVDIESEYTFRANIESNVIKISMDPLATDVIQNNNFIHLQVTASNNRTTAVALVILEIIKDDYTTPVFENNFYGGSYSTELGLTLEEIVLTQGFDETVKITLEGEHFKYFQVQLDGARITLTSATIPPDIFNERNIMITVLASKPRTVGAHATVKIALPSDTRLEFENSIYEGTIKDNVLQLTDLKLKQGYEGFNITVDIKSEYTFRANIESNVIKISMDPLAADVIQNNNFIHLQVTASNNRTTAVALVILEIIKDDFTTPVFENNFYSGSYNTELGLTLEEIVLTQGFDETVKITLEGEHFKYFQVKQDGARITLTSSTIPPDIFDERNIMITVLASKPRTVGAHATVKIALPSDTRLEFENSIYEGTITHNVLQLSDLKLKQGYEGFNITVDIESEYTFRANIESNVIKISMDPLAADVIQNNNFINFQVTASNNRTTAVTVVILEIIKDDYTTPVFENNFYIGSYNTEIGLTLEEIVLTQGFDETVKITLEGEHFKYFQVKQDGARITLTSSTIPPDIFNERNIIISVVAYKPRTVGAHATVKITLPSEQNALFRSELTNGVVKVEASGTEFPKDLTYIVLELQTASASAVLLIDISPSEPPEVDDVSFDQILYNGKLNDGIVSHDKITLSGFNGTNIQIKGEHNALFKSELTNGVVKVEASGTEFPKDLTYIVLELQAASASAVLLIDISPSEPPEVDDVSFDQILYNGKLNDGIVSHDKITLSGFNGTNIQIKGEHNALFKSELTNGVVKVEASGTEFPKDLTYIVLELQAASASAVLLIDISPSEPPEVDDVSFDQILYNGKLQDGVLSHDKITLSGFTGTNIQITGEHNALFRSELTNGVVNIEVSGAEFPKDLTYIVLELQAASASAILLIDINVSEPPEDDDVSFDQFLYNGILENGILSHDKITLSGFDGTNIQITGEHNALFRSELANGVVKIEKSGGELPKDLTYILLELQAASANAILLINVSSSEPPEVGDVSFDQFLYNGILDNGILSHDKITLSGFDGTNIQITGEHNALFRSELTNGIVKIEKSGGELPKDLTYILLELQAASANAILLINVSSSEPPEVDDVSFDQILYTGKLHDGVLSHDKITLSGFNGTNIQIKGEHSALFKSELTNGVVKVEASGTEFPKDLTYIVLELQAASASAILLIDISPSEPPEVDDVSFDQILYNGKLQDGVLSHDKITLSGFTGINIQITGEHNALFRSELTNGVVNVEVSGAEFPKDLTYIVLELQAASASAILLIDISVSEPPEVDDVSFDQFLYNGILENGVLSHDKITLSGFDGTNIQITGEHNALFRSELTNGVVKIERSGGELPKDLTYILLELQAASANAILLINVSSSEPPEVGDVSFDQFLYNGILDNGILSHDKITLSGFDGTNIQIIGEHNALFRSELTNDVVKIETSGGELPKDLTYILLELQAASANAILLINVSSSEPPEVDDVSFDQILYTGKLHDGVLSHDKITLSGFNGTNIQIKGEHNALFKSELTNGVVKVEASGTEFPKDLTYIVLELQAASASAILLIDISPSEPPEVDDVSFDQILYNGKLQDGVLSHDKITLSGFTGTNIQITGEHNALFRSELTIGVVNIEVSGAEFPKDLTYIVLELQAASASAILLIDISSSEPPEVDDVSFDQFLYNGILENGVLSHDKITLSGFDGTNIQITGEHNALFRSELTNGVVKIETSGGDLPKDLTYILLELQAASANAILLINVSSSEPPEVGDVSFDHFLYNGILHNGVLSHDKITLSGFDGTNIQITGEHNALFRSELANGVVKIEKSGGDLPKDLTYILLELQAASANAILLINVSSSENPQLPSVSFKSQSYFLWADVQQTGVVGTVEATADNGEAIVYSLSDINEHIQSRININDNGEILLTAAFDKGVYRFNAVATSAQSQVQATAPVLLRVDTVPECSNEAGLSPLIILERLEEEPHLNLVVLNQAEHKGCRYTLSNIFPKDQSWLYVDNDGLHTKAIDREDTSIAFMTLSQIQVELTLDCDSDEVPALTKRSLGTEDRTDLYSYDDVPNKWVLTDTIMFNAKRSLVNLIVKDINDNSPIFLGKGNEPIYVGYPVSELEGTVLPRALAELKATDADIGENAAIMYWSSEDNLAVSPNTGLVHVRNNAQLENNSRLTIYAIDQNGRGRNGTIDIEVKLLDKNQIVVLTVRDAFLEDEVDVLNELSEAVGYEIKVLRAVVIPNNNEELSRRKRDVASNSRASLQLYVYGLLESEPVDINQLTRDISNINEATVNIARIVSLEDHLEDLETRPGRGLLASTITLAILLFLVLVAVAVWFFLKWKKTSNYKQFSNRSSGVSQLSTPNLPKIEVVPKSRPDIDEIKRTERRLQDMLNTPVETAIINQADKTDNVKPPVATLDDAIVNISHPDAQIPIVYQSIDKLKDKTDESDDNDEYGEVKKPRKSVVTFNENVEKIIHIEDVPDDESSENGYESYKF